MTAYEFIQRANLRRNFPTGDRRARGATRSGIAARGSATPETLDLTTAFGTENLLRTARRMSRRGRYRAAGPDGVRFADLSPSELADMARGLSVLVTAGTFSPSRARRVTIHKRNGDQRVLRLRNLPTRIVAKAAQVTLQQHINPLFLPCSFGFRPGVGRERLLARLLRLLDDRSISIIAQDDIRAAFDNLDIGRIVENFEQLFQTVLAEAPGLAPASAARWVALIRSLLSGHPSERRVRGVDQGSPLSPLALNVHLHLQLDSRLDSRDDYFRFADNLVVVAATERLAHQSLDRCSTLLEDVGLSLNQRTVVNLESGAEAEVLGWVIRRGEEHFEVSVGESTWAELDSRFARLREKGRGAEIPDVARGFINSAGPALEGLTEVVERTVSLAATRRNRAQLSLELEEAGRSAWRRWVRLREPTEESEPTRAFRNQPTDGTDSDLPF